MGSEFTVYTKPVAGGQTPNEIFTLPDGGANTGFTGVVYIVIAIGGLLVTVFVDAQAEFIFDIITVIDAPAGNEVVVYILLDPD